jgi:tetratricopeptide (TPR) repeat protein
VLQFSLLVLLTLAGCGASRGPVSSPSLVVDESPQAAARVWHLRAVTAESRGDIEEADHSMAWAVRMNRTNPWVHIAQGRYLERQERPLEALIAYESAWNLGGSSAVYEALGGAFFRLDRDVDAIESLEKAGSHEAYAELANHFMESGDRERGQLILERWAALTQAEPWIRQRVALASWVGEPVAVWADYIALLHQETSLPVAVEALQAAEGACAQGAVWEWAQSHSVSGLGPDWRDWALEVAEATEDRDWYEALLEQKATADGDVGPLLEFLLSERRFQSLHTRCQRLLEAEPDAVDGHRFLGAAYRGLHRYEEAAGEWRWVLDRVPTDEEAVRMLIRLRLDQGLSQEAFTVAEAFLGVTGDSEPARMVYATVLAETGDLNGALAYTEGLSADARRQILVELYLEAGELESAWAIGLEAEAMPLMLQVARHGRRIESTTSALTYWTVLHELGVGEESAKALFDLGALSLEEALLAAPCEPTLLLTAWEESRNCDDIHVLEKAYQGFPMRFADRYSQGAARCDRWPEALSAAERAIRIEDSEARRRHLDYVKRAAESFERARRKP